ncbi:MAG: hypothetical protein NZ869_01790 [Thermoanaerobaculum sp.]|nr:hypothetical protein [Thermoanaerobaculum sp.]MDW7967337.1 hypothetical protein [Thermoanaerobaculum sp.]
MEAVEVFAPARADLAGGTLDLWPLWCFHPGSLTVNTTLRAGVRLRLSHTDAAWVVHRCEGKERLLTTADVGRDLTATVVHHFLPEGGVQVEVVQQPPMGSGLGGSSVYAVALAKACTQRARLALSRSTLVAVLKDLEAQVLGAPTGVQDYYPALYGGTLAIHLRPGGERIERLAVPRRWLAAHLLVVFTGLPHHSGLVNWQVYRARVDGHPQVVEALERIAQAARRCRGALLERDASAVGYALAQEWEARRGLAAEVCPPALGEVLQAGLRAGAWAAKACGAGGGGSVLFWTSPRFRQAVEAAVLARCRGGFVVPL